MKVLHIKIRTIAISIGKSRSGLGMYEYFFTYPLGTLQESRCYLECRLLYILVVNLVLLGFRRLH